MRRSDIEKTIAVFILNTEIILNSILLSFHKRLTDQ